ncbi:hypothetical protein SLA_4441 [Streptomyces laurentii]|uniref:Uncharacterized protein n=1 Tax=Streptomyces laurentii TaxID=39478 RepID=A0A160P1M9_STRLU|nr:hypothetical protein SLA_4441 [Streptomyces laurentii]
MSSNAGGENVPDDVIQPVTNESAGTLEGQQGAYSYLLTRGGVFEATLPAAGVDAFSKVFASITERDTEDNDKPFLGGGVMTVHNVVPRDGGIVTIRADVGVPNNLNLRVDLFYYNGS